MKEEQNINGLPKDWKKIKLGELCEIVSGNTPKGLEQVSNKGKYQFYKVSDMNLEGNESSMITSNLRLTEEEIKNLRIKVYPKGTVIFPKRGGAILTNKKRILSQPSSFDLNVMGILPNESVESSYLYYWFQKLDLTKIYDGSNVPQINTKNIAPLEFPLPTINEQRKIVSKIEELFSELDKGIEELKTAQQQLKVYRQAVLKWAFEGKLTNEDVKQGKLPEGWKWIELNQQAKTVSGYAFKSTDFKSQGVAVIKISNIGYSEFVWKDQEYLPEKYLEQHKNFAIHGEDLLIALTRPITNNTTKVCKYPKNASIGLLNQRVASIKEINGDKEYLFWYFQTDSFKNYIRSKFSETLQPNLSPKDLAQTPIPFCSLDEQQQIVQEIESRLSVCDKIEEIITNSLKQAEALRQSILKKAFEGKLL
jgi:type I restriction enzyme S subunit